MAGSARVWGRRHGRMRRRGLVDIARDPAGGAERRETQRSGMGDEPHAQLPDARWCQHWACYRRRTQAKYTRSMDTRRALPRSPRATCDEPATLARATRAARLNLGTCYRRKTESETAAYTFS